MRAALTGPEFDSIPYESGREWELLDGELIPVSSPTPEHQLILQQILLAFLLHLDAHPGSGLVFTDVEFALTDNYRVRPDVLLVSNERALRLDLTRVPVPGSPDLAVEIISPTERSSDTEEKLQAYLRHGTREVWQVYSKSKAVVVHGGGTSVTLSDRQHLTTSWLPEFSLAVEKLFTAVGR